MLVMIAMSSSASCSMGNAISGLIPHSSRSNSSQSWVSSASWRAPPNFETNSASDRAREASRTWAATEGQSGAIFTADLAFVPILRKLRKGTNHRSRELPRPSPKLLTKSPLFHLCSSIQAFRFPNFNVSSSNRVHKRLLDLVEHDDSDEKQYDRD